MLFKILDGKIKKSLKHAVLRSYSVLAINAKIGDGDFNYTVCGMAKLLQEASKYNS